MARSASHEAAPGAEPAPPCRARCALPTLPRRDLSHPDVRCSEQPAGLGLLVHFASPRSHQPTEPGAAAGTMALDEEMGFVGSSGKKRRAAAAGTPAVVIPVAAAKASAALAVPGGIASRGAEPAASRPAQLAKPSPLAPAGPSAAAARGSGKAGQSSAAKGKSKQKGPPPGMTTLTRFFGPAAS